MHLTLRNTKIVTLSRVCPSVLSKISYTKLFHCRFTNLETVAGAPFICSLKRLKNPQCEGWYS